MKQIYIFVIFIFVFLHLQITAAEEEVFGIILYAEGDEISIYQNDGSVRVLDVFYDDIIGEPLYEGESIETDDGSYVEIQIYPSEHILKLSESTALTLDSISGSSGGSELSLIYGSIRAKVEKLTADNYFDVRTGDTVAGVRGTDFGVDYLYDETEGDYLTDVICFEGEIEVREKDETDSSSRYSIGPDEQISVHPQFGGPPIFRQKRLAEDRKEFWQLRDFREVPIGSESINNRFPGLRNRLQTDSGVRRLTQEQRKQPGFRGLIPDQPGGAGQSGNRPSSDRQAEQQQSRQQNDYTENDRQQDNRTGGSVQDKSKRSR